MNILVTGGAGYIGSHTVLELLRNDNDVSITVIDNLMNSSEEAVRRVEKLAGKSVRFLALDVADTAALTRVFSEGNFDIVLHFAGLKSVGESVANPLVYYRNNLDSTLTLLEVMKKFDVHKLIFSSSATVYGSSLSPYTEENPTGQGVTNPYGQTKYFIEQILRDTAKADQKNEFTLLRYFNPIGADVSGEIGEYPQGTPNNLMPYITQVAVGEREKLHIFGDDYATVDGTGVRDYIHVSDLAAGHIAALQHSKPGLSVYNLGSGHGTSVLQLIHAFEEASGQHIPYDIVGRRDGDLAECYADVSKANHELSWHTKKTIRDACEDSWRWQSHNPKGYEI